MSATLPFHQWMAQRSGSNAGVVARSLLQYGRTSGVIGEIIARQVASDEGVQCNSERVLVTAGCQEAVALCLQTLCADAGDAVLMRNPTYIGGSAVAHLAGIPIYQVTAAGADLATAIDGEIRRAQRHGHRIRALYLIPEFDNPTGEVLDDADRRAVLEVCARHRVVVLEDNPYGMFRFDGTPSTPMATLDNAGSVIYLGTYSKTLCPTLRVGYAVVPETLWGSAEAAQSLFDELTLRKSYVSVNTSAITQAMVAGFLLQENFSLRNWIQPSLARYRQNRDRLLLALDAEFADLQEHISWNRPAGGFFLTMDLPFEFGNEALKSCAADHQVLVMPMSFFALDSSQNRRIRLAYSYLSTNDIGMGVSRLGAFIRARMEKRS
jgi:(S)-3,5-dihydroxyphenylglycine transaminase